MATNNLFKGLAHLLAAEGIYQRINHRITHDEYEVHIELRHKARTVEVLRARDHQNEMEEERSPAHNENAQQHSQGDSTFHAGPLPHRTVSRQSCYLFDMSSCQEEHVYIQRHHEEQHGEEHGDKANDDISGFIVNDKNNTTACTKGPDACNNHPRTLHCHDVVVAQGIEDGDIPIHCNGQQTAHGSHYGNADHGVKHIVNVTHKGICYHQVLVIY